MIEVKGYISIADLTLLLQKNPRITISLEINDEHSIQLTRSMAQYNGYPLQDTITVTFVERDDDERHCYSTEFFNADMLSEAAKCAIHRRNSHEPYKDSPFSLPFEDTFYQTVPKKVFEMTEYPKGLTVKELKELLEDWPETDENGKDTMVFITDDQISKTVHSVWPDSVRENADGEKVYHLNLDSGN